MQRDMVHRVPFFRFSSWLEKLDEFRIQRFESRAETIHWLLEFALSQKPKPKK